MKRFVIILFTVVFVIVAAVIFAPSFIDWSTYKDQATQQVKEKTGLTMKIAGDLGFFHSAFATVFHRGCVNRCTGRVESPNTGLF